jgi:hypothetical protein
LLINGSIFIGNYNKDLMCDGKLFELQSNGTYSLFQVEYNNQEDSKKDIGPS